MNKIKQNLILALIATFLLGSAPAMSAPLNLDLADNPDIFVTFAGLTYDALAGTLDVNGFASQLWDGVSTTSLGLSGFSLFANVDNAGNLSGGNFSFAAGLLDGNLTGFGFSTANNGTLEFLFDVTGGSLATLFGGVGANGGIIMTLTDFAGDWTNNWVGSNAQADVAALPMVTPEPGILLLTALGLPLLILARRRKI